MKQLPKKLGKVLECLETHETFCITGHARPDGDCIGSQLALAKGLLTAGKKVHVWNEDVVPDKLAFLDPDHLFAKPEPGLVFDCVITVDSASFERLGSVVDCIKDRKVLINIDHHPSNTRFGDLNWIMDLPSTGEIIYRLFKGARWKITPEIANCLFTAISTDTGSFQYPTTKPETYHIAGELVKRGASLKQICEEVYQSYPLSRVKLLRIVYNRFKLTHNNQLAYFWLKKEDFTRTGANASDTEGLIDHIRSIEPVKVACVFEAIEPEVVRVSFRSKDDKVNVSDIAMMFGGGGHKAAAGARICGKPMSVQRKVVAAIKKALDKAK